MGLPGAGKTYLATELIKSLDYAGKTVTWFNADNIRARYDDWDFSAAGRIRQSHRMRELADSVLGDYVVCDFVAPLPDMRDIFAAEWTIWVDTISQGRYFDTNELFCPPDSYHFRVTEQDATKWAGVIAAHILNSGV
jgi:adenylylsulfate kinase